MFASSGQNDIGRRRGNPNTLRQAFTLIELLVVIAIILPPMQP